MKSLLLWCSMFVSVYGLYENADVVHLNGDNFDRLVTRGSDTWIVQFYSSYCPYCKEFAPTFEKAASMMKGNNVQVGVVDADEDKTLLKRYEVKGIPNVKIYYPSNPVPETYNGARTAEALLDRVASLKKSKRNLNPVMDSRRKSIELYGNESPTEGMTKVIF